MVVSENKRAVGAEGLIVEVHRQPERATPERYPSLFPYQFDELMTQVSAIAAILGCTA